MLSKFIRHPYVLGSGFAASSFSYKSLSGAGMQPACAWIVVAFRHDRNDADTSPSVSRCTDSCGTSAETVGDNRSTLWRPCCRLCLRWPLLPDVPLKVTALHCEPAVGLPVERSVAGLTVLRAIEVSLCPACVSPRKRLTGRPAPGTRFCLASGRMYPTVWNVRTFLW